MIDDNILLLIILIALIYIFEHKIIPTLTMTIIAFIQLLSIFSDGVVENDVNISFAYAVVILYSAIMILTNKEEKNT